MAVHLTLSAAASDSAAGTEARRIAAVDGNHDRRGFRVLDHDDSAAAAESAAGGALHDHRRWQLGDDDMPMNHDILCDEVPLTNPERKAIYRRKLELMWLDEPERGRDKPVLWQWLRLCWGLGSPPGRQAE